MPKTSDLARKVILSSELKRYVDLNTDFGQTSDLSHFEDAEHSLLAYVSSVNIPCCVHDGTPSQILRAIEQAKLFNCAIGAHIGYPDPGSRGYEKVEMPADELRGWLMVQIGAFRGLLQPYRLDIEHIRPHGALYRAFVDDEDTARFVAATLYQINPWFILVGPAGPLLEQIEREVGIRTAGEIYLGKRYNADGTLLLDRFHEDLPAQGVLDQARQLIRDASLTSHTGETIKVRFQTLHISPKLAGGVALAEKLCQVLGQPVPLSVAAVGESGWV
ncbi:MAG: LamB/YcsF family protein [Candidatus Melainabacteria bacterium]|nr:LamB/YcsF family protein [Candidatus Melainabacteria bacterium]